MYVFHFHPTKLKCDLTFANSILQFHLSVTKYVVVSTILNSSSTKLNVNIGIDGIRRITYA